MSQPCVRTEHQPGKHTCSLFDGRNCATFNRNRQTVAALVGVRLAVAERLCRPMGSLLLTGRIHAAAVADWRAAARFDAPTDGANRCRDFWLGGCTRRSHRVARLVFREAFHGVLAAVILTPDTKDLVWGEIRSNQLDGG
jgi:hypothetical protein